MFMAVEAGLRPFFDGGPWMPSRLVAAVALGPMTLAPPPEYAAMIQASALGVHFSLSLVYGRLLALLMYRWGLPRALEAGAAFGVALYLINFHALAGLFPLLAQGRGWTTALSHAAFGIAAAALYKLLEGRHRAWI